MDLHNNCKGKMIFFFTYKVNFNISLKNIKEKTSGFFNYYNKKFEIIIKISIDEKIAKNIMNILLVFYRVMYIVDIILILY